MQLRLRLPVPPGQLAVRPTNGDCQFAMAFQIERGSYGAVSLDGLGFIVLGLTPEEMGKGNWSVGLVTDARATAEQRDAMTAIASGAAGGPMAALSGLIGKFLGVESAPIAFDREGATWSVTASDFVDMAAVGARGLNPNAELRLENTGHPAADTLHARARIQESRARARPRVGRRDRQEQRSVRAFLLEKRLARASPVEVISNPSPGAVLSPSRSRHHLELRRPPHRTRVGVSPPSQSPDVGRHGSTVG